MKERGLNMNETKHDLSFDSTKLDFQALVKTAAIAYSKSRYEIERELSELQHQFNTVDFESASFPLCAERLASAAKQLSVAASTYHTLLNAYNRHEITIINKPEVKEVA